MLNYTKKQMHSREVYNNFTCFAEVFSIVHYSSLFQYLFYHPSIHILHQWFCMPESEGSITVLCLLCSPRYTAVRIKNYLKSMSVIKVATVKNMIVPRAPVIIWNWSIHCLSLSAMFNSLQSSTNQELFEKHLCNQGRAIGNSGNQWKPETELNRKQKRSKLKPWCKWILG